MAVEDASIAVPKYDIDKIIQSNQDTMGGSTLFVGTGFTGDALVVGIYSVDGGTSWRDFGNISIGSGYAIQPAYSVDAHWRDDGVIRFTPGASGVLVRYAVVYIEGVTDASNENLLYFSGDTLYQSSRSYMKIALEGSYSRTASAAETRTIPHTLGYVPFYRVYIKAFATDVVPTTRVISATFGLTDPVEAVTADENNIYITTPARSPGFQATTIYYRIYHES